MVRKARNYQELGDVSKAQSPKDVRNAVSKVGRRVGKRVITAAQRKIADARIANPDERCGGSGCTSKAKKGSLVCKRCETNASQIEFVYGPHMEEDE